jgi:hypothetical protein
MKAKKTAWQLQVFANERIEKLSVQLSLEIGQVRPDFRFDYSSDTTDLRAAGEFQEQLNSLAKQLNYAPNLSEYEQRTQCGCPLG